MFPSELNIMDIEEEVIALHMYILSLNERWRGCFRPIQKAFEEGKT
jgi:hypothetical protein